MIHDFINKSTKGKGQVLAVALHTWQQRTTWPAWANDTAAHYTAIHCLHQQTTEPTVQPADVPLPQSATAVCKLLLTTPTDGGMARLSWPGWLVTQTVNHPSTNPALQGVKLSRIIGSDWQPETKQGIERKIVSSDREWLETGLGLGIRITDLNEIADLKLSILAPVNSDRRSEPYLTPCNFQSVDLYKSDAPTITQPCH